MAKSKSFFGLRKGSTKTMTFSVLRGQQITKDRVVEIANPRTMNQTSQRIPFAQAVKFYKQATKGLFRFAFEDKRPLESDYNAYMRHNVERASSVSRDDYNSIYIPAIGRWMVSYGTIPTQAADISGTSLRWNIGTATSGATTVGGVSTVVLTNVDGVVPGDIVTFVAFNSQLESDGSITNETIPVMEVNQFVINPDDDTTLASLGFEDMASGASDLEWDVINGAAASAGAVIISRNTPSGLKVSSEVLTGNSIWNAIVVAEGAPVKEDANAYSWGAQEKAILQGSLADKQ